jgi:16S rRNA (cytidine1402-2'-O)-methyltransferase
VCRELTKRFEEVVRGPAAEVAGRFAQPARGEVTVVLGPGRTTPPDLAAATDAVTELAAAGLSRRRAAELVARLTGVGRNELYRRTL